MQHDLWMMFPEYLGEKCRIANIADDQIVGDGRAPIKLQRKIVQA